MVRLARDLGLHLSAVDNLPTSSRVTFLSPHRLIDPYPWRSPPLLSASTLAVVSACDGLSCAVLPCFVPACIFPCCFTPPCLRCNPLQPFVKLRNLHTHNFTLTAAQLHTTCLQTAVTTAHNLHRSVRVSPPQQCFAKHCHSSTQLSVSRRPCVTSPRPPSAAANTSDRLRTTWPEVARDNELAEHCHYPSQLVLL